MPALPAALREIAETAPLYAETAVSRNVRWSFETGHLPKLPKRKPKTASKTASKTAPKSSKPTKAKPPVAPEEGASE